MTPVEIVNVGIVALGERPIHSFADGSTAALCALATFRSAARAVLERDIWNDAAARAVLAEASGGAPLGYARTYMLPGDCLRVRDIAGCRVRWTRRGRQLLTDAPPPLEVLYTRDLTINPDGRPYGDGEDTGIGSLLGTAIGLRWAWGAAKRITGSESAIALMRQMYERSLVEASAADAGEGTVDAAEPGSWLDSEVDPAWLPTWVA